MAAYAETADFRELLEQEIGGAVPRQLTDTAEQDTYILEQLESEALVMWMSLQDLGFSTLDPAVYASGSHPTQLANLLKQVNVTLTADRLGQGERCGIGPAAKRYRELLAEWKAGRCDLPTVGTAVPTAEPAFAVVESSTTTSWGSLYTKRLHG